MKYLWDDNYHLFRGTNRDEFAYSDGIEVEDRLLAIVSKANDRSTLSTELAGNITDWPNEYHLSASRHCLVRPLGLQAGDRVLELGCGCGAITRFLGEVGADVVAVEGSIGRARIAAERCRELPNVRVVAEDLLRFETDERFDCVLLVGVLEYAAMFSDQENPFEHYLRSVTRFLSPAGRLVIAIENKLGLKYFNGCGEDHVGVPFFGVQDLYGARTPRTFGRLELIAQLAAAGLPHTYFYYPFPDYKLPFTVLSEDALSDGEFDPVDLLARCHARDYHGSPYRGFDDALAFCSLHNNNLLAELSNSFLVVARTHRAEGGNTGDLAVAFSVRRIPELCSQTRFVRCGSEIKVLKESLVSRATRRYVVTGSMKIENHLVESPYRPGRQLLWDLLRARARAGDLESIVQALSPWVEFLVRHARVMAPSINEASGELSRLASFTLPGDFLDCTPFNLLDTANGLVMIDVEWHSDSGVPLGWVVTRGILYSLTSGVASANHLYSILEVIVALCDRFGLSVSTSEIKAWLKQETAFQSVVTGRAREDITTQIASSGLRPFVNEITSLGQAVAMRDEQIASLNGQVANLDQRVSRQDERIASLNQAVATRDEQITSQEVATRAATRQIADLKQTVLHLRRAAAEREGAIAKELVNEVQQQLALIEEGSRQKYAALEKEADVYRGAYSKAIGSRSWKITAPLRSLNLYLKRAWHRITFAERRRLKAEAQLLEASRLFQAHWYLQNYPDVAAAGVSPMLHYLVAGWKEGRNPSPLFNTRWYLERYADVDREGTNPLLHFIRFGAKECRMPSQAFAAMPLLESQKPSILAYLTGSTQYFSSPSSEIDKPYISIIILNLNKAFLTLQCLVSLWKHTDSLKYEVIVVDNASTPDDLQVLDSLKGPFRLIPLTLNRFFGEANNIGAEAAQGDLLVFMNNDVVVTQGWLAPLVRALQEKPGCGAAGPKFIYPDGRLQEAGGYVREDGAVVQRGKGQDPADDLFNEERSVDYISAATVVVNKSHFLKVGGFDFRWEPAYYEDVDLCLKLRCLGLKMYYVPQSTVIHYENATTGDTSHGLRLQNIVEVNRKKLVERWSWYLKARETTDIPAGLLPDVLDASASAPLPIARAALFTPYNFIPGGGERYLLTLAEALSKSYQVTLVTPERYSSLRIANVASALRISVPDIRSSTLREVPNDDFDVWVAMGNAIVPPAPARGKLNILVVQFPFPLTSQSVEEGRRWWDDYDLVVVYSEYVKKHVIENAKRYAFSMQNMEVISPPVLLDGINTNRKKYGHSILNVGRFFTGGHCKNQHLMIEAFRAIVHESKESNLELHLVGSLHPEAEHREYLQHCRRLAEGLPVFFHLDASFVELQRLYSCSSIYWHATGLNADLARYPERAEHFGISIVEAMSAECIPIVYASGGPAEIIENGVSGLLYNNVDQLIALTKQVAGEWTPSQVNEIRAAARARARCYDAEAFKVAWLNTIKRRGGL